jgi:hypothetical protein
MISNNVVNSFFITNLNKIIMIIDTGFVSLVE